MKHLIKKWLGIDVLDQSIKSHTASFQALHKSLGIDKVEGNLDKINSDNIWLAGICNALLEHLGVDYYVAKVPDHRYPPVGPILRDEIKLRKVKK